MRQIALCLALLALSVPSAVEQVVWQIGKPDKSYAEFAIARDYPAYPKRFGGKPLVFKVGKSDTAKDWPFILPGPTDAWAGHRVHPFKICFNLPDEPRGLFRLRIELANTHWGLPPTYAVSVGGRSGHFAMSAGGISQKDDTIAVPLRASGLATVMAE